MSNQYTRYQMGMFEKWGIADVSNLSSYPWTTPYSNGTYWGPAECSSPSPPPTYSILDYSISPTHIRNLDIPVTPVTTADLLAQQRADRVLHTPKPKMPLQKRTIRRTRVTGMSKDKKEVRVQLTSKDSIPTPDPESISISDMKRYLYHRKLITLTSSAPVDLIRELYQTAIASDWNEPAPE